MADTHETLDRLNTVQGIHTPEPDALPLARVMIAAPDPDLRLYIRQGLDGMAVEIVEAGDGVEALNKLAGQPADLVIADAIMPRLDGVELARVMAPQGVPVVLLDGVNPGDVPGATVLAKPFDRQQLRNAVRRAVAHDPLTPSQKASRWQTS